LALGRWLSHRPIVLHDGGRPIRDFVYIRDVARALAQVGVRGHVPAVLNIGAGRGYSIAAVVEQLGWLLGTRLQTEYGDPRSADIPTSVLDVSMARRALDFEPQYSLRDGLIETLTRLGITTQIAELR
jgi:UDP-glucose 4-epimerase